MHVRIRHSSLFVLLIATGLVATLVPRELPADPPSQVDNGEERPTVPNARLRTTDAAAALSTWTKNIAQWRTEGQDDPADNSYCIVCHLNYKKERLVTLHKPAGVGCETCHGISDKHSEDEDNLVPPDVMFSKKRVGQFCMQCHLKKDLIQENDDHKGFFVKEYGPGRKTCTECHSMHHTLKTRTRRWNKDTRKLQSYDGVRMMQQRDSDKK